jgi:hypothetical protein
MSNHTIRDTDSTSDSRTAAKELLRRSNPTHLDALDEDNLKGVFIWSDEKFVQNSVKMLCTNYNLDQL